MLMASEVLASSPISLIAKDPGQRSPGRELRFCV
jgi:hypothetical protein